MTNSIQCVRARFACFLLLLLVASAVQAEMPNIILCMGDDHGWDETAYNGHPHLRTPVLDEMAATGLRLDRFYSASPVCSPTRGSVITGRHPNRYGTFTPNWSLRPEEISIAHLLSKAGYHCGHFGKWHLGPVKAGSPVNPGAMGFHEWLSHDNFFEMDPQLSRNGGPPEKYPGEGSAVLIEQTIKFIESARGKDRPFFAVVWFGSPHEPYSGLESDLALYDDLPSEYQSRTARVTSMKTGRQTERPLHEVLRERYAEITAMDRAMGQLRDYLAAQQLRDNTVLWYCGDNGVPSDGRITTPLRGQKGRVYEGGVRVPGIIEWPARIPEHRASSVNSVTSDILPTLCAIAGQPLPDRPLDGVNLVPLFDGSMQLRPSPIYFWNYDTQHELQAGLEPYIAPPLQQGTTPLVKMMNGVFTRNFRNLRHPRITEQDFLGPRAALNNRYKLIVREQAGGDPQKELFDVLNDPAEKTDLIARHPSIAADLERQLRNWQESVLQSLTGADY